MFPVYTGMNPYPYHKDQFPSTQYYHHPNWEAIPPQKKEDPVSSSCYGSWPYNCGYPTPIQYNICCAHAQHPAYYNFRPPCSHFPPPPPPPAYNHFCRGYPSYPQSPPIYYPPPPHYSPIYEYDKTVPRDQFHCCGCVDHPCPTKGRNNVKIEEQEPDAETKKSESLFPGKSNNFTYPIFWIPPGYAMTKEDPRRLAANEVNGQQVVPYVKKPEVLQGSIGTEAPGNEGSRLNPHPSVQSAEEGPNLKNGWFPLDINSIKKLMEGGDALRAHDQKRSGHEKKLTAEKGKYTAGDDDVRLNTEGGDKKNYVKIIPVKQLEESVPKNAKKLDENKVDETPVSKASQGSVTNPVKKSKLPPICLRVDPPKKKNSNGSSRSASPPGDKKHRDPAESNKEIKVEDMKGKALGLNNIEESRGAGEVKKGSEDLNKVTGAETEALQHTDSDNDKADDLKGGNDRVEAQESQAAKVGEYQKESKQEKEAMSEMEAAVIIQSVYRGYDVRRWEPLTKLKQIAKVREEAIQVKNYIKDLESVAIIDDKEKTAIGETIMKLLLKLDSIQGLHQGIRDVRRSIAKELIMLQERLDCIPSQKSTLLAKDSSIDHAAKESEGLAESLGEASDSLCLNGEENATASEGEGLGSSDLPSIQPHSCEEKDTSEASLINIVSHSEPQDGIVVSSSRSEGDDATFSLGFEFKEEPIVKEDSPVEDEDSLLKACPVEDTVALDDSVSGNLDQKAVLLSELPREIVDESVAAVYPIEDITAHNNLVSQNEDQKQSLPTGQHQEIGKELVANVSSVEDMAVQNGMDAGNEAQEDDKLRELVRDNVEDGKETPLALCDKGSPNFISPGEEHSHEDAGSTAEVGRSKLESLEITNDDDKELTEVDTSGYFTKDDVVDKLSGSLEMGNEDRSPEMENEDRSPEVGNEDNVVVEHENHKSCEISGKESLSGEEAQRNSFPVDIVMPVTEEVETELPESTVEEMVCVLEPDVTEEVLELPSSKEKKGEEGSQESQEMSDMGCPATTVSIMDVHVEEDAASVQHLEGQNTVVGKRDGDIEKKIIEENVKLREMLEKLLAAGKEQQEAISNLNGKVKNLEKKLVKRKKIKSAKHPRVKSLPSCT